MKKRGIFSKKAAAYMVWFILLEILLIAIISTAIIDKLISAKENTLLEKNYLSKDIALTTTAINSAPGEIYYVYSLDGKTKLSDFNYEFNENKVLVSDISSSYKTSYGFISDKEPYIAIINSPNNIIFEKEKNKLIEIKQG